MMANQKKHSLTIQWIDVQPLQTGFRDLQAAGNVVFWLRALARVVQQQREIQKIRLLELFEQFRISLLPLGLRFPESVEVLDGYEAVLVHREPVRIVADHERIDSPKLRQQRREHAERMHGPKRFGGVRGHQNLLQIVPKMRALG